MADKPTILITGVSGNLGLRLLERLPDFQVLGVDLRPPATGAALTLFEKLDLAEERSCDRLLELMRAYRPDGVAHLAFSDGDLDRRRMWHTNVSGAGRVVEAITEHNRLLGGISKFIFAGAAAAYGPGWTKPFTEDAPLHAHTLPFAVDKKEADLTVQARAKNMKCRSYILRLCMLGGAAVQNHWLDVLRGVPGGHGALGEWLRKRGTRLPVLLPSRGGVPERKVQFVHLDDAAGLVAHIFRRTQADPQLNIFNVAGQGDPLSLEVCARIAGAEIRRLPGVSFCHMVFRLLRDCGISSVPPEALAYLLDPSVVDATRLRAFLGDEYRRVIQHTCAEALAESFAPSPASAPANRQFAHEKA